MIRSGWGSQILIGLVLIAVFAASLAGSFNDRTNLWLHSVSTLSSISPPYTFFLLNDDMELNRNWQLLV
jgi:hypothetical protein